uniref:CCHC-type domain-containing protein n=1 Tax=Triticum urartu TaxID=4572 RepID=A0A8R7UDC3_TRIUA
MACDADSCGGWQKVMPRRNVQCPVSLGPALAPRPIPAWLHSRCCRCLYPGHRAAECRDPFRCSRCLENGHRARGCRNARRPLSFLGSPTLSPLPRLPVGHQQASVPCKVQKEAAPLSKTFGRDSWASIVAAPASSVASEDIPVRPALERQAELLRSELLDMASFRFEEMVRPLRDVVDSMQGWMLWMESFMERVEAALGGLSLAPPVLQSAHVLCPLIVPDGSFEVERGDELHGCFSPRARASSPPSAYEGLGNDVVVTPLLQIMPELRELCGGSV